MPIASRAIGLCILLVSGIWLLSSSDIPHDRDLFVRNLPRALRGRLLGPLQALRQERKPHPSKPNDGRKDAIHDHVRAARPGKLQPKPSVDSTQRDERNAPPDVDIGNQRPAPGPLEAHVMQQPRERLEGEAAADDEPDACVVALHVLVAVGHPDAHGHDGECDAPGEDLPGCVQPDGDAAREDADQDRAHGEEEGEGEAAQDAVGQLDLRLEPLGPLSLEEVIARVPVVVQCVLGIVAAGLG